MRLPSGLVYTSDSDPGLTRKRAGRGFAFYDEKGGLIRDGEVKARLKKLALPPAYREVWFCARAEGHLQATGLDDRGRKQYRYHPAWEEWRNGAKFHHLLDFARVLPRIRRRVARDLAWDGLEKERVLAAVVRLLDKTAARIGNEVYHRENGSTGLTTLREKNVNVEEDHLLLSYVAKGGKLREFDLYQPKLAELVAELHDLPGQRLFQYEHGGKVHPVTSADVNRWLQDLSGEEISAKDFRTWHASELCLENLLSGAEGETKTERVRRETEVLKEVSTELGHRPPVCKKHYIHPEILSLHREGKLFGLAEKFSAGGTDGLSPSEARFLEFLKAVEK